MKNIYFGTIFISLFIGFVFSSQVTYAQTCPNGQSVPLLCATGDQDLTSDYCSCISSGKNSYQCVYDQCKGWSLPYPTQCNTQQEKIDVVECLVKNNYSKSLPEDVYLAEQAKKKQQEDMATRGAQNCLSQDQPTSGGTDPASQAAALATHAGKNLQIISDFKDKAAGIVKQLKSALAELEKKEDHVYYIEAISYLEDSIPGFEKHVSDIAAIEVSALASYEQMSQLVEQIKISTLTDTKKAQLLAQIKTKDSEIDSHAVNAGKIANTATYGFNLVNNKLFTYGAVGDVRKQELEAKQDQKGEYQYQVIPFGIPDASSLHRIGTKSPGAFLGRLMSIVMGVMGTIALLIFVYGGFLWMISSGDSGKAEKGRQAFLWASLGIMVILSSYAIVQFLFDSFR